MPIASKLDGYARALLTYYPKTLTYSPNAEVASLGPINSSFGQSGYYRASTTPLRELGLTLRYAFGSP
jgi:hypothetical protein